MRAIPNAEALKATDCSRPPMASISVLAVGLLRLLARVVFRVNVGDHPRADIVELNHRLLVHGHKVRGAWRKRDEASCRHCFRLARIGLLTHPDKESPRDHGEEPGLRKRMRRDAVALRQLEPHREEAV